MDTIWTPEFAEAGWLRQLTGAEEQDALDDVLDGPKASVQWKNKTYAVPLNTNVQLLWYRKDLVPTPPETWDEMIAMAKKLPAGEGNILEQGQKYEGYVVWFNNLVASAGGTIVNAEGRPTLDAPAVKAAQIIKDVATSGRVRPVAVHLAGGPVPARVRGRQGRLPAELAVRLRGRAHRRGDEPDDEEGLREHGLRALARRQQGRAEQGLDRRCQPRHPEDRAEPGAGDAGRAVHDERQVAGPGGHQRGSPARHERDLRRREGARGLPVRRPAARAAQGLGRAPGHPVVLGRDAGDPVIAAPAGEHQPAEVDQHAARTA